MKKQKTFKATLREDVISALRARHQYFSINFVRAELARQRVRFDRNTLKQYMARLQKDGFIHDAGKGWYSTIATAFVLDTRPMQEVIGLLVGKFPLLRFDCWSTEQIRGYTHHTLNKFVVFVHVGKDAMRPVFETLSGAGWNAYLNPGAREVHTVFSVRAKTVVVRATRAPDSIPVDHHIPIEEILIELHQEAKRLTFMDAGEVKIVATRVVEAGRVDMGNLTGLAADHKLDIAEILGREYTIAENR